MRSAREKEPRFDAALLIAGATAQREAYAERLKQQQETIASLSASAKRVPELLASLRQAHHLAALCRDDAMSAALRWAKLRLLLQTVLERHNAASDLS